MSDQTPRILIVEDDPSRCDWFRTRFVNHEIDVTCEVSRAIEWLTTHEYDAILLDHDLIAEHYLSDTHDDERTGYMVAHWLANHPDHQREAIIIIHSLNYYGAQRMLDALNHAGRDAEHIPFPYLQSGLRF